MANRVIQIGYGAPEASNAPYKNEVYRDLSMVSQPSGMQNGEVQYKVSKNVNAIAVRNAVANCFTWIPGERILLPEFGSRLYALLYEGITPDTEEQIVAEIRKCVSEWEPRAQIVEIRNASTIDDTENNTIHIEVVFTIAGLDDKQYVYSFTYNMMDQ